MKGSMENMVLVGPFSPPPMEEGRDDPITIFVVINGLVPTRRALVCAKVWGGAGTGATTVALLAFGLEVQLSVATVQAKGGFRSGCSRYEAGSV